MLRHFAHAARRLLPAACLAIAVAGCGIKGPLKPAPTPEPAQSQERDAKRAP
jgi:predicted small lipoprotein YifL